MKAVFHCNLFFFVAFSAVMCASCSKSAKDTTIVGKVLTYGTEEIIDHPPVKVQLYRQDHAGCWGCGYSYPVIDEMWTDSSMSFALGAKLYPDENYFIGVDGESVHSSLHYIPPGYGHKDLEEYRVKSIGGIQQMHYKIAALGWVRFHFYSENPQPGDIYGYNAGGGASEVFYGYVDETRIIDYGGNFMKDIALNRYRDGEWENWQVDFFVPAFDTIDVTIDF